MNKNHESCTNCGGCKNKTKPADCKNNGCGRCCGGGCRERKEQNNKFLLILLEKQFLPFVYTDNEIIFKEDESTTKSEIANFSNIITQYQKSGYLTLDFGVELDDYSYQDYTDILSLNDKNIKKGTMSITQKCFDEFLK